MVATYHYDAKTSPACVVGERSRPLESSGVGTGVCASAARRSIRTSVEGELEICECADIDGGCNWKVVCMGLHSGCRGQMVRPCLVHFLGSPLLLLSILPFLLPKKTYSCTLGMGGCGLYSGLFLKENGEWKHFSGDLFVSLLHGTPCRVPPPLRSHRNRRYVPRKWFQQAYARPPSGLRDSATSAYSLLPFPQLLSTGYSSMASRLTGRRRITRPMMLRVSSADTSPS